jgi:hypothetical protein
MTVPRVNFGFYGSAPVGYFQGKTLESAMAISEISEASEALGV